MVSVERRAYLWKTELALAMVERALERGHLRAGWFAGGDAFWMSPSFREGLGALGIRYVLDVPGGTTVWPLDQPSLRSRLDCSLPISTRKLLQWSATWLHRFAKDSRWAAICLYRPASGPP